MRETFEDWARGEISRLRAEADALQRALDKYLESHNEKPAAASHLNGSTPSTRRPKTTSERVRKGTKRSFVLARIGESIGGSTISELFNDIHKAFPDMKRSSLRAMLYLEAKSKNIERRGDRYVLKQDRPSEPTPGLSD
jgi:hypothetical protein